MPSFEYKIPVFGRSGVGKTSIVDRFVCGYFVEEYDPTIGEDHRRKQTEVDGQQYNLDIFDTYGDLEEYPAMRDQYIRIAHGFLLVYSIDDLDSFNKINDHYNNVVTVKNLERKDIPIVLVGAKCDLEDSREVTREQGEELARQLNCPFFETSAKDNICVDDAFAEIVREIRTHCPPEPEPEPEPAKESKKSKLFKFLKRK